MFRIPLLAAFVLISAATLLPGCKGDGERQDENGGVAPAATTATFDNTQVKTGYTLPVAQSTIMSEDVTLTINPPAAAANVTLVIVGTNRATVENIRRGPGTITFNVKGTSATPENMPNGDTFVVAREGNRELARANVIVVIPKGIGTPHPTFNGVVTGRNIIMDGSTSPAFFRPLNPGQVKLATVYQTILNVPVDDQFGARLDRIYAGTAVTEQQGFAINQDMQADGTYRDPVGLVLTRGGTVPGENPPGTPSPQVQTHLAAGPIPPRNLNETQAKLVQVGGHSLNPDVRNRTVAVTPSPGANNRAQIEITWP